jgi:hypothetical protein
MNHFINWNELENLEKEAKRLSKNNGQSWGGARPGAGRPKKRTEGLTVDIKLNNIQSILLREMGDGDIKTGVQRLIDQHV